MVACSALGVSAVGFSLAASAEFSCAVVSVASLDEIIPILNKKCQTVAVLGLDKNAVVRFLMDKGVRGIDRVVNIGDTMGLEFIWDGYNMIETMSREVDIYVGNNSIYKIRLWR